MQSVPITTKVMSSSSAHGEVYSMRASTTLCDKVCQRLATGRRFSPVSSTSNTDNHDITEIMLKVLSCKRVGCIKGMRESACSGRI
jgi:hypothetical protein